MNSRAILLLLPLFSSVSVRADDWPQWLGPKRDGVWRESGIIQQFPSSGPKVLWRAPVGMGYSGPAVVGDRVYVTDRLLAAGANNPKSGFARPTVPGTERVLCVDATNGKELWKHEYPCEYSVSYPAGPRTTPVVNAGKVYTLGTMGDLCCLDAGTGKLIWSKNFVKDYEAKVSQWGFSSSPLLDGDRLICLVGGENESLAVAFHKDTGKEIWRALTAAEPGYSPPVIFEIGSKRQLIIWHPESINSLDPESGKVHWSVPFSVRAGLTAPMARQEGDLVLVTSFYNGSMMLKLTGDKPAILWKGKSNSEQARLTDGLHAIMATPILKDGHIYGVCSYGELRCLKADTGERVWMSLKATGNQDKPIERWANAFLVANGDRFFLFNEKGDLIIARLTPQGYEEISRAHILEPTNTMIDRPVVWTHPAFANRSMYARNDKELVCVSLAENQ